MSETYKNRADFGHRLFVEPSGIKLSAEEREILSELKPLSFLFRARNFNFKAPYREWLKDFSSLLEEIRECVGRRDLLLSIDHEGGRVTRPPLPITRFPYAAKWGDKVKDVSKAMAIELASLGLNVSWAPVADVLTNRESKAIGQRAFSGVTSEVESKAALMAATLKEHGIAAGGKHFPGYGAVTEDAHYNLSTAHDTKKAWEEVHLPPFKRLIADRIPFIMTAHVMYPSLDPNEQATLSKIILKDILRDQLGYDGVVVADALGMGAIKDQIETKSAIIKALQAELDLFCIAGDSVNLQTAQLLADQMIEAYHSKEISSELLDRSRNRIETALRNLPQHVPAPLPEETLKRHAALAKELDPNDEFASFQYIPKEFA